MPAFAVAVLDEQPGARLTRKFVLQLHSETVSARELIEARVRQEVTAYNEAREKTGEQVFAGLVQPDGAERVRDGYRLTNPARIDAERQCQVALAAFVRNGFFMLVDDRQVEFLDERVLLSADSKVSFVKLVPLVGG